MTGWARALAKRYWPALHLRTILFSVLLFTAAMPGLTAIFLRVYENTLVRQTEAELAAQGAALAAAAGADWPGANSPEARSALHDPTYFQPQDLVIDLSSTPVLAERPAPRPNGTFDPDALKVAALFGPVIERTRQSTLASILLLDRSGNVVWGNARGNYGDLPEFRQALDGQPVTVMRRNGAYRPKYSFEWLSRASDLRLHYARPIIAGDRVVGVLLLSRSPRALFRGIYEDRLKIMAGGGGHLRPAGADGGADIPGRDTPYRGLEPRLAPGGRGTSHQRARTVRHRGHRDP